MSGFDSLLSGFDGDVELDAKLDNVGGLRGAIFGGTPASSAKKRCRLGMRYHAGTPQET
jgi:hypothetical protein